MSTRYVVKCHVCDIDDFGGRTITYFKVWLEKEFDDLRSAEVFAEFQRNCGGYDKVSLAPIE